MESNQQERNVPSQSLAPADSSSSFSSLSRQPEDRRTDQDFSSSFATSSSSSSSTMSEGAERRENISESDTYSQDLSNNPLHSNAREEETSSTTAMSDDELTSIPGVYRASDGGYICTDLDQLSKARQVASKLGVDPAQIVPSDVEREGLDPSKLEAFAKLSEDQQKEMLNLFYSDRNRLHGELERVRKENEEFQRQQAEKERKQYRKRVAALSDTVNFAVNSLPEQAISAIAGTSPSSQQSTDGSESTDNGTSTVDQQSFEMKKFVASKLAKPGNEGLAAAFEAIFLKAQQAEREKSQLAEKLQFQSERFKSLSRKSQEESQEIKALIDSGIAPGLSVQFGSGLNSSSSSASNNYDDNNRNQYDENRDYTMMQHSAKRSKRSGRFSGVCDDVFDKFFKQVSSSSSLSSSSSSSSRSPSFDDREYYRHSRGSGSSSSSSSSSGSRSLYQQMKPEDLGLKLRQDGSIDVHVDEKTGLPSLQNLAAMDDYMKQRQKGMSNVEIYQHSRSRSSAQSASKKRAREQPYLDQLTRDDGVNIFHGLYPLMHGQSADSSSSGGESKKDKQAADRKGKGKYRPAGTLSSLDREDDSPLHFRHSRISNLSVDEKTTDQQRKDMVLRLQQETVKKYFLGDKGLGDVEAGSFQNSFAWAFPEMVQDIVTSDLYEQRVDSNSTGRVRGRKNRRARTENGAVPQKLQNLEDSQAVDFNTRVVKQFQYDDEDRKEIEMIAGLR